MFNTALTYLELLGIGVGLGLAGPCLLVCTPVLITYIAGKQTTWKRALIDIFYFLTGRFLAYLMLGYLAGLSGAILRQFCNAGLIPFIKVFGGVIIIFLGVYVWLGAEYFPWLCKGTSGGVFNFGSLFILGFTLGVFPCAPLLALLLEITLISKTPLDGMCYALFFGLGTFISGFIAMGVLSGIFTWFPPKVLKSKKSNLIFRIICAALLIWLGLDLIFKFYPHAINNAGAIN